MRAAFPLRISRVLTALAALVLSAAPAVAADTKLTTGFAGALKGCEEWVLNPKSWIDGPAPFLAAIGLGERVTQLSKVGDFALPPPQLRQANHYWRIDATGTAGFVLVTSDRLPMCHITGAGQGDFPTSIAAVLSSPGFLARWERTGEQASGPLTVTSFRSRVEPAFDLLLSQPTVETGGSGVRVIATAQFKIAK